VLSAALSVLRPSHRSESAVLLVAFLTYLSMGVYGPLVPSIQAEYGASASDIGLLISSYALGRLVISLPAGRYLTRYQPGAVLVVNALVIVVGSVLSAVVSGLPLLIAVQLLRGIGLTGMVVVILTYLGSIATPATSARVFGRFFATQLSSLAISPWLVGLASIWWPWREVFLASALGPLLAAVALWVWARSPGFWLLPDRRAASARTEGIAASGSSMDLWRLGWPAYLANFISLFVYAGVPLALYPLFGAQILHLGPDVLGLVLGLTGWGMVLGTSTSTVLGERFGKMRTLALGYGLLVSVLLPLAVPSTVMLVVALALVHLGIGLTASLPTAMLADRMAPARLGSAIGITRAGADIGWLVAPTTIGLVLDGTGFGAAFWLAAALSAIGCAVFVREARAAGHPTVRRTG